MKVNHSTKMLARFVQIQEALNDQSKNDLLTPNIDKVVVSQRLLVGYGDFCPDQRLDIGILLCPNGLGCVQMSVLW